MRLNVLLGIAAIYMTLVGLALIIVPKTFGVSVGAVPADASAALIDFLRLWGGPLLGIAVLDWTARNAIILGNIVGFGTIAAVDVWSSFGGVRLVTKVFAIVHLLFALAFIWVGRKSMSAKSTLAVTPSQD